MISALAALGLVMVIALTVFAQGGGVALNRAAPEISGGPWINSAALEPSALRGRVVLVDFWTYG